MNIFVTGAAGFIGFHASLRLLDLGHSVVGLDNLNDYYDVSLKHARLKVLTKSERFRFIEADLADRRTMAQVFVEHQSIDVVLHLGAQAGVRYSITNPNAYIDSNIVGTANVLEGCRHQKGVRLIYASSSSVYGDSKKAMLSVDDRTDNPISLYAATKKSTEVLCYSYAHLYDIDITGLRFFTVYGPYGRPDMAYFKFTKNIIEKKPIDVYNNGNMSRDFTYIDDIVDGIERIIIDGPFDSPKKYRIYNLGNNEPEKLLDMLEILEKKIGKKAVINWLPMQPGDVTSTYADIATSQADFAFTPKVKLIDGLDIFVNWYFSQNPN